MDPNGHIIPIVDDDQGEGMVTPIDTPILPPHDPPKPISPFNCVMCGAKLNRKARRIGKQTCVICTDNEIVSIKQQKRKFK